MGQGTVGEGYWHWSLVVIPHQMGEKKSKDAPMSPPLSLSLIFCLVYEIGQKIHYNKFL